MLLQADPESPQPDFSDWARAAERARMAEEQISRRGISDQRVVTAMRQAPRHAFVPDSEQELAYADGPLPLGEGQTISQPYIVAYMTEQLRLLPSDRVLEIGAGCGYQTAILSCLVSEVVAIEVVESLAREAAKRLQKLRIGNVTLLLGDGSHGYPDGAPYDAILVAAAAPGNLQDLAQQLKPSGRLVAPFGPADGPQSLKLIRRGEDGALREKELLPVRFVPLIGGD